MNTNLNDMLKHIVNNEEDDAQKAFHNYVKDKMRSMIVGTSESQSQTENSDDPDTEE